MKFPSYISVGRCLYVTVTFDTSDTLPLTFKLIKKKSRFASSDVLNICSFIRKRYYELCSKISGIRWKVNVQSIAGIFIFFNDIDIRIYDIPKHTN